MIRSLRRLRRDDTGSALVIVLMISILALVMVGTATSALISQVKPSKASLDDAAALAAAQAGLDDFLAWVNLNCPPVDGFSCAALTTGIKKPSSVTDPTRQQGTVVYGADGTGANESFYWTVIYASPGVARVKSVGQVPTTAAKTTFRTRTLIADLNATPNFTNFQYFTKYETYSTDFVTSFYRPRTVQINSNSMANSSLNGQSPGVLSWSGTCSYVDAATTPSCDPNHSANICEDLYYASQTGAGRATSSAWNNSVRRPSSSVQTALGTDNTFSYYSEPGSYQPNGGSPTAVTHDDTCDTSFEPNMVMNGPVYSQDAYLIDRGKDTGNSGNSMPNFNDYAYSLWNGTANGTQQPAGPNGGYDRAYPNSDGRASVSTAPFPVYTTDKLDLPPDGRTAKTLATCTYTGPTRILVRQNYAYITSPGTATGSSACYHSTGAFSTASATGVVNAQVPISNSLIYVQNPTSGTVSQATRSNPVFGLVNTTPVPPLSSQDGLAGTWDSSAYSSSGPCPSPADPTKRRNFDCEAGRFTPREDLYANVLTAVNTTLSAGTSSASALQTALNNAVTGQLNSAILSPPANFTTTSGFYYAISVPTPSVSSTTPTAPTLNPPDALYQTATTGGFTSSAYTGTITINRMTCATMKKTACNSQRATPIITGSVSLSTSTGTPLISAAGFPWFGASSGTHTYTDPNNDITPYYNGYGDAYVEGTLKGNLSIVAEHDIVVTNDLSYSNTNLNTTTDGLALVATHNVRVYRPMTCTDDGTAGTTSAGWCPDDLTGVFNQPLSWPLPTNFPSTKYQLDNAPSLQKTGQGVIYATIFALRGSFLIDNFYRGPVGASVSTFGGLYQYHRGPTSLPYQGRPFQGSGNKMPGMTLSYTYDNMRAGRTSNGGLRVPWIPNPSGKLTSRTWNVISLSSATGN
jgi:Tfp pilus assembly protein PilX